MQKPFVHFSGICRDVRIAHYIGETGIWLMDEATCFTDSLENGRSEDILSRREAIFRHNKPFLA